ncbi:MAG: type IV secretory system conjugative DNA transfer family protein [Bacteroidota bacterium]
MEVTAKEKEAESSIINASIGVIISLALMYLANKYSLGEFLLGRINSTDSKSFENLLKIKAKISDFVIFREPYLLLYFMIMALVLYGIMNRGKTRIEASQFQANCYLALSGICFVLLQFSNFLLSDGILLLTLILAFMRATNLYQSLIHPQPIDQFNEMQQSFPQTERLINTSNSINLAYDFFWQGWRRGFINMLATTRGTLVLGTAGSGKTASILLPALWQSIYKGQSGVVYDFKYPNMSLEAFNALIKTLREKPFAFGKKDEKTPIIPKFISVNFNDLRRSARVNPIQPQYINSVANAQEIAKMLLTNLNRSWIGKESEFFNASAINLVAMAIYFLKLYSEENKLNYCTLPHVVELVNSNIIDQMQAYEKYQELRVLRSIFQVAIDAKATDQLGGQIASALNSLAPLASKEVYWVLSDNDFDLEINNPEHPTILCLGSDRENKNTYGSLIAVIFATIFKTMKKGNRPGFVMIDELPTIYLQDISYVINTIREIGVSVWLGIQDLAQLINDYKKEGAEVVMNSCSNIFWGNVNFETAEKVSKIFGKTNQGKINISIGAKDEQTQYQMTTEQKELLPPSLMTTLTPGRFAGKLADTHTHPLEQKLIYGDILIENIHHEVFELPLVTSLSDVDFLKVAEENYFRIVGEVEGVLESTQ